MAGGLRSQLQAHGQNTSGSSTGTSSHPIMSHVDSQSGGRRRKSRGKRNSKRRSRRAGSSCNKGGSYMSKSRSAAGGMGGIGLGAVIKEALVPFGLFAVQKRTQRRRSDKKKFGKSRRRR